MFNLILLRVAKCVALSVFFFLLLRCWRIPSVFVFPHPGFLRVPCRLERVSKRYVMRRKYSLSVEPPALKSFSLSLSLSAALPQFLARASHDCPKPVISSSRPPSQFSMASFARSRAQFDSSLTSLPFFLRPPAVRRSTRACHKLLRRDALRGGIFFSPVS